MKKFLGRQKSIDTASVATILVTVVLFIIAIFEKGATHEILLEAGVFLISVKLILASAKSALVSQEIKKQLSEIQKKLG